jgi:uncharacterized integral membrane protein
MILALVVALFSGIFAVQNTSPVTVNFLGYTMESSLAIVMLLTFSAGSVVSLCVSIPAMYMRQRRKQKQVTPLLRTRKRFQIQGMALRILRLCNLVLCLNSLRQNTRSLP